MPQFAIQEKREASTDSLTSLPAHNRNCPCDSRHRSVVFRHASLLPIKPMTQRKPVFQVERVCRPRLARACNSLPIPACKRPLPCGRGIKRTQENKVRCGPKPMSEPWSGCPAKAARMVLGRSAYNWCHTRMPQPDDKLKEIAAQLKRGVAPPKESVRSFLRWFYAERRGYNVVLTIRQALKKYGITTDPNFEFQYIDGYIGFVLAPPDAGAAPASASAARRG